MILKDDPVTQKNTREKGKIFKTPKKQSQQNLLVIFDSSPSAVYVNRGLLEGLKVEVASPLTAMPEHTRLSETDIAELAKREEELHAKLSASLEPEVKDEDDKEPSLEALLRLRNDLTLAIAKLDERLMLLKVEMVVASKIKPILTRFREVDNLFEKLSSLGSVDPKKEVLGTTKKMIEDT